MPFEYFVRPFQTPDVHGRIILPATPQDRAERATITWGASTPGVIPTPRSMGVNVNCCNESSTEQSRAGTDIQITANNDPESYITINRATEVKLKKTENDTCDSPLTQDLYSASGVKAAFAELSNLIHSSDADYAPAGTSGGCGQILKLKPNTTA